MGASQANQLTCLAILIFLSFGASQDHLDIPNFIIFFFIVSFITKLLSTFEENREKNNVALVHFLLL
jgi:hypothetical protein